MHDQEIQEHYLPGIQENVLESLEEAFQNYHFSDNLFSIRKLQWNFKYVQI